jgi:hypothetical protein
MAIFAPSGSPHQPFFIIPHPISHLSDQSTGCCEALRVHSEKFRKLHCSPYILGAIKSRRMGWNGHVACIGGEKNVQKFGRGKPEGKRTL